MHLSPSNCNIRAIGKRRDGGTRYWCTSHRGDATAKYGLPATQCRYANLRFGAASPTKKVAVEAFPGGIALWGAVPPVYDTTLLPIDVGIHVHARAEVGAHKIIDETFPNVELTEGGRIWRIEELDAVYQMVANVFGITTAGVKCTYCGNMHLDKDWFGVHAHQRHLCSWCGRHFNDSVRGVGNPIALLAQRFASQAPVHSDESLDIRQKDYPGGIRIWGSNPALAWTSLTNEWEGIHVHTYSAESTIIDDETYGEVTIDGVRLDPYTIRVLMAQNALPHLTGRVRPIACPYCAALQLDTGSDAFTPRRDRKCASCRREFVAAGRLKNVIANPALEQLAHLTNYAIRMPACHDLGLLVESP